MINLGNITELALLVHDMQNDALKPGGKYPNAGLAPGTAEFIANSVRLLAAARSRTLPVFHSGHFLRPDYKDVAMGGRSAEVGALQAGTWGADFIDELKPAPGEWLIRKGGGFSAFTGTALEKWMHRLGVTTLIIGGCGTAAGIASTVYGTRERDFKCILVADACNGAGTEKYDAAILNMSTFVQIASTQEVVKALTVK